MSNPGPSEEQSPYDPSELRDEIQHLYKESHFHPYHLGRALVSLIVFFLFLSIFVLYSLEPIMHAIYKREAIQSYRYLFHCSDPRKVVPLENSGILTSDEINIIQHERRDQSSLFNSSEDAEKEARQVVAYASKMNRIRLGHFKKSEFLLKIRYWVFTDCLKIPLPSVWPFLNPTVTQES